MAFVSVIVFRQRLRQEDREEILREIPEVFAGLARARGQGFTSEQVAVAVVDAAPRNVFAPESHAKGLQGLDVLLQVYARIPYEEDQDDLREGLESLFRDRWVARARIFDVEASHWHAGERSGAEGQTWSPREGEEEGG